LLDIGPMCWSYILNNWVIGVNLQVSNM
jgi:hypothetical protein